MPEKPPRVTFAVQAVLAVFMAEPAIDYYGYDVLRAADLPSGTLYPLLARFERDGLVESYRENPELFASTGRPPRRYYRLTRRGVEWAQTAALQPRHRTTRSTTVSPPGFAWEAGR